MLKQILLRKLANQFLHIEVQNCHVLSHTRDSEALFRTRFFSSTFFIYKIKVNLVNFFYKIHVKFLHSEGYINQVT